MGQRLGIAAAMLGDPGDADPRRAVQRPGPRGHPVDPQPPQAAWPTEGRTVFLSSHLMSEMAMTAEHLIVVGRGRLIADTTGRARSSPSASARRRGPRAHAPSRDELREALDGRRRPDHAAPSAACWRSTASPASGSARSRGRSSGIVLHELTPQRASLEEAYMEPDRRRRRVPRRRLEPDPPTGGGRMSAIASPAPPALPRAAATSRSQRRAVRVDEAVVAAFHAVVAAGRRRSRWRDSAIVIAAVQMSRWSQLSPRRPRHATTRSTPRVGGYHLASWRSASSACS